MQNAVCYRITVEFSPLCPQREVGFAVSNVTDQMCHLCRAFHHTSGEMVLFRKVKNGTRSNGTNWNFKPFSLCYKNQSVVVILEEKNNGCCNSEHLQGYKTYVLITGKWFKSVILMI